MDGAMEDVIEDSIKNDIEDINENDIKVVLYFFAYVWIFLDKFVMWCDLRKLG